MISFKYECLREVIVVTDPFFLTCLGFNDCNVFLVVLNSQLYINCNCLPYLFLSTSSPQKLKQVSQLPDFLCLELCDYIILLCKLPHCNM